MNRIAKKNTKKILVTGGSGFVGENLLKQLRQDVNFQVFALSRKKIEKKHEDVTYLQGNLLKSNGLRGGIDKIDVVVHLAANVDINNSVKFPSQVINENTQILLNLLDGARSCKEKPLIVYASTDRVYGKTNKRIVTEKEPPLPIEPYTASKIIGEIILQTYNILYEIPYIILRFDSIYGPGQSRKMFISDIIQKMLKQDNVAIGDLSVKKNFVFVEDAARAIIASIQAPAAGYNQIYNIGSKHVSLADILVYIQSIIEKKLHKKITIHFDHSLIRGGTEVRPFRLSIQKADRLLGWKPTVPLEKGLEKTIDFFINTKR